MLPNIWIFDSYTIMVFLGIILCFAFLFIVQKKKKRFTEGEFFFNFDYCLLFNCWRIDICCIISKSVFPN